jgi:hypothetical protein
MEIRDVHSGLAAVATVIQLLAKRYRMETFEYDY